MTEAPKLMICPDCCGAGGDNNTLACGRCGGAGGVLDTRPTPAQTDDALAQLPQPLSQKVPDRIWLLDLGGGEITWSDDPQPDPGDTHDGVEYVRAELILAALKPSPVSSDEGLVEELARVLYQCEKVRSDKCDAIISAAAGKTVSVGMEPWEKCWQVFYSDADAILPIIRREREASRQAMQAEIERLRSKMSEIERHCDARGLTAVRGIARAALEAKEDGRG